MSETLDPQNLIEELVSSHEKEIESIGLILDTNSLIFSDFQESMFSGKEERSKVNAQLQEVLAQNGHLRKKDFNNMMQEILSTQESREVKIRDLLKNYFSEHKAMTQTLRSGLKEFRESLAKGEAERIKKFQILLKEILAKQQERKNGVTSRLKEFQEQQSNLSNRLRELLARGNDLRIKDLKSMLKEFKAQRKKRATVKQARKESVNAMIERFKRERQKTRCSQNG